MKFVLKGRIRCTFRVFPGPFYYSRGPSLVELTGDDDSTTRYRCGNTIFSQRVCRAITYTEYIAEYGSTAGEVANPARGQLNRENTYFPICPRSRLRVWSRETRSAVRSRVSLLILQPQAEYECFVLLPVVYRDGTFKTASLTLWNPQGEITPKIWYKSSQS